MTAAPSDRRGLRSAVRRIRITWPRWRLRLGRSAMFKFAVLAIVTVGLAALVLTIPAFFAAPLLLVPFLIGASILPLSWLTALLVVVVASRAWVGVVREDEYAAAVTVSLMVILGIVFLGARARSRLGVQGSRGESMLFDLRERLLAQGELPVLPPAYRAEVVHRSAHGDSFGGDFLVSSSSTDGSLVEISLVDVSGKGIDAGTRALLLSGAFGGLLGSVAPDRFLPAANSYLVRQRWDEGFATAVHAAVDVRTGEFSVGSAGHPPAVHFHSGSGEWEVLDAHGTALGVLEDPVFVRHHGRLLSGDALLLYTDGLVEQPDRDLSIGIDRMLGAAEHLVTGGFERGALALMTAVPGSESDDRACILLWRL